MSWIKHFRQRLESPPSCATRLEVSLRLLYSCFVALVAVTSCNSPVDVPVEKNPRYAQPGMIRSVARIDSYSTTTSRLLLWWADLDEALSVEYDVVLYRLEYWTSGPGGALTFASGLVALPEDTPLRGVVSWQHGTQTVRDNVPSSPSTKDGILTSIAFAGHGFLLTAPDYIGHGISPGKHSYLHAESEANAVIDLLKATRSLMLHMEMEWPETLFLTGFSQGGHASLAAQRSLEAQAVEGLQVTASAPIAGLYNLSENQFPNALKGHSKVHSLYLGYVATSYSHIYNEPLSSVISENYSRELPTIFEGNLSLRETMEKLPATPAQLFQPNFLSSFSGTQENWFIQALLKNDVHNWTPQAPIRFYYGSGDKDSMPADTQRTVQQMAERGGNVTAVNVGNKDHNATVLAAVPRVRNWFDQLLKGPESLNRKE